MNPVHYKAPPSSPDIKRMEKPYDDRADESSSEEIYANIDDKEEGQGKTKPVPVPKKTVVKVEYVWNDVYFGD